MEPKSNDKNGCFPSFGNNFLTLFGLMVLDDEEQRIRAAMVEEEDQEAELLDMNEDDFDEPDEDPDDDYDEDDL